MRVWGQASHVCRDAASFTALLQGCWRLKAAFQLGDQ